MIRSVFYKKIGNIISVLQSMHEQTEQGHKMSRGKKMLSGTKPKILLLGGFEPSTPG